MYRLKVSTIFRSIWHFLHRGNIEEASITKHCVPLIVVNTFNIDPDQLPPLPGDVMVWWHVGDLDLYQEKEGHTSGGISLQKVKRQQQLGNLN